MPPRVGTTEAVQARLARARRLAGLNSMICLDEAGALAAARRIDALRTEGAQAGPLAGLCLVVKDNIDVAGLPTTGATPALRGLRPQATAPALQRLIDAGAIVLGKANMHELAFGVTNTNAAPFAGAVGNPWDPARVPGGSSGGTAAAIAAGIANAGLGTDTGGSVRIPASFCGLSGLRPSVGDGAGQRRYDPRGALPISRTRDTIGPMARTMAEVALLDGVLAGGDAAVPVPLQGVRLGVAPWFFADMEPAVAAVIEQALAKLSAAGAVLVDVKMADFAPLVAEAAFVIALHEAAEGIPAYIAATDPHGGLSLADVAAAVASADVRRVVEAVLAGGLSARYRVAMAEQRPRLQGIYARCFLDHGLDALVFPTVPVLPPRIADVSGDAAAGFFPIGIRNTDPGSTAGLPGITLPAGVAGNGLPVGLALDGPVGSDRHLLGMGMAMQDVLGALPLP